jgi:hypothetical protein
MNDQPNGTSLSLDDVVRRFAESEHALDEARSRLQALAAAEQTQAAAAEGLQQASSATTELLNAARALIAQSEETQRTAREVLQAGAGLIDGTDLRDIQTGLASIDGALKAGLERLEQLIGDVQSRDQRISELQAELARCTGAMTGRQRKKLGLS